MKKAPALLLVCCVVLSVWAKTMNEHKGSWSLNTFPGPGHKANPVPWGPGQGASRSEAINDFGVSPVDGNFMLFLTDLSSVAYSNSTHPFNFKCADIPTDGGSSVAFHGHDGTIGYALLGTGPGRTNRSGKSGWWRTDDQGKTWSIWYSDLDNEKKTRELYGRCWGTRVLLSDPHTSGDRKDVLYFASYNRGLVELHDKQTYTTPNGGNVIAFSGKRIKTITGGLDGNNTVILAVVQENGNAKSGNKDNGAELWKVVLDASGNPVGTPTKLSNHADWTDIQLDPNNPGKGYAIRNFGKVSKDPPRGLVKFDNWGENIDNSPDVSPPNATAYPQYTGVHIYSVYINPSNSDHVVLGCHNGWAWQVGFDRTLVYTTNGTSNSPTWQGIDRGYSQIGGKNYITDFTFYGPPNYHSVSGNYAFQRVEGTQDGGVGRYGSIDFVPGSPNKVRLWAGNWSHRAPLESNDYGKTFKPFAHGGTFKMPNQVAIHKDGSGTLHIANCSMENGIWVSHDGGLSWEGYTHENQDALSTVTQKGSKTGTTYNAKTGWGVAFKPNAADNGRTIIACYGLVKTNNKYETYILRSTNGGSNWEYTGIKALIRYSDNNQGQYGRGHYVHWGKRKNGGTAAYVGNKRSRDDGASWTDLDYDVFAISSSDADLIVGTKYSDKESRQDCDFYFSVDGGDSWKKLTGPSNHTPKPNMGLGSKLIIRVDHNRHFLAIDPSSTASSLRILFAGAQGIYLYEGPGNSGEWKGPYNNGTTNNGITLRNGYTNVTEKHYEVDHIYFDPRPGMDSIVYCANSGWHSGGHDNNDEWLPPEDLPYRRVFMSTDGGRNWKPIIGDNNEVCDYMGAFGMTAGHDGKLYVSSWGGLYIYDPNGTANTHYNQTAYRPDSRTIQIHSSNKDIMLQSTETISGVRISDSRGRTILHQKGFDRKRIKLPVTSIGSGLYILTAKNAKGISRSIPFIR